MEKEKVSNTPKKKVKEKLFAVLGPNRWRQF